MLNTTGEWMLFHEEWRIVCDRDKDCKWHGGQQPKDWGYPRAG